jgi:nitrous oxide reductase
MIDETKSEPEFDENEFDFLEDFKKTLEARGHKKTNKSIDNRTTEQMSVTIPKQVLALSNLIVNPAGFNKIPKGTYSELFSTLLKKYVEDYFGAELSDILEVRSAHPHLSLNELKKIFEAKNLLKEKNIS